MTDHQCEAQRRDGTPCPHKATQHLNAQRAWSPRRPKDHHEPRTIHLCGQHKNAIGKGVMAVPLAVKERVQGTVHQDREGKVYWDVYPERRESPAPQDVDLGIGIPG